MNLFQAVNDAMSIALTTDERAGKLEDDTFFYSLSITHIPL